MKFIPDLTPAEAEAAFAGKFTGASAFPGNAGGQGIVFKAHAKDPSDGKQKKVALKIYFAGSLPERTDREVQALRRLQCDTLVKLYEAGQVVLRAHSCMYVATEFIDGDVLSSAISIKRLTVPEAIKTATDLALAIDTLWKDRIVHRDIKPQNIMRKSDGRSILIDLGVARHLSLAALTTAGKTWGTEGYMSPEHARALRQLSCKSDIFALGIVLLESLLGQHPTGHSQAALSTGGLRVANLGLNLPPDFGSIVEAMISPNAVNRPHPNEVIENLKRHL